MPELGQKSKGYEAGRGKIFHPIALSFIYGGSPTKKALAVIHRKGLISVEPAKRLELLTC